MNILITGGGFIGQALARRLAGDGHAVGIVDVAPRPAALDAAIAWRQGDVGNLDDVTAALDGRTHVIHLAALLTPDCRDDALRGARVNLLGTLHVFEAARRAGIAHVVYASSAGVYGPHHADHPEPHTLYGTWKLAAEGIARAYRADHGLTSVGLRPFVVYGSGRESGLSSGPSLACRAAARREPYTIPFSGRSGLVHVDDVVAAFAAALQPKRAGAFVFDLPGEVAAMEDVVAAIRTRVPDAQLTIAGPPLPICADVALDPAIADVLGPLPFTPLADGIAATLAACSTSS